MVVEALVIATAQLIVGVLSDRRFRVRRNRKARSEHIGSVASELGVTKEVVLAVEGWLERSDVSERLGAASGPGLQSAIEDCLPALRFELATVDAPSSVDFATRVASTVIASPNLG